MGRLACIAVMAGCSFRTATATSTDDAPGGHDSPAAIDGPRVYLDANLSDGLIAWYRMEQVDGKTAEDSSGNGHTGTCGLCPTVEAGHLGMGFHFDGTTRVDVADVSGAFDTTAGFTVAAWVRYDTLPAGGFACPVGKVFGPGIYNSWELCYAGSDHDWLYDSVHDMTQFDMLEPHLIDSQAPAPVAQTWYHTAMTWDGTVKTLWIDGHAYLLNTPVVVAFDNAGAMTFGADTDGGAQTSVFVGVMDELRIYDHALSADAILQLATP